MNLTIALDAMGGDHGPSVTVPASLSALEQHPDLNLILVGDQKTLGLEFERLGARTSGRLAIRHASEQVQMHELPSQALRAKKDSSMRVAVNLVKERVCGEGGVTLENIIIGQKFSERSNPPLMLTHNRDNSGGELMENLQGFIGTGETGEVRVS